MDGGERNLYRRRTRRAVARCKGVAGHGKKIPFHRRKGAEGLFSAKGGMTMGSMRCGTRKWYSQLLLGLGCVLSVTASLAADAVPDTDIWLKVRESFFGARPI